MKKFDKISKISAFIFFTMVVMFFCNDNVFATSKTSKDTLRKYLVGDIVLSEEEMYEYDYDFDGLITINDLIRLNVKEYIPEIKFTEESVFGEGSYYKSATRQIEVYSKSKLTDVLYCITDKESCTPDLKYTNDYNNISISFPNSTTGQRICMTAISEGGYESTSCDQKVYGVDSSTPTAPTITGGNTNWALGVEIKVDTPANNISGILKYQYYISDSKDTLEGGEWLDCTTSKNSQVITKNGTHYVFFRAISNSLVIGEISKPETVKIDDSKPTRPVITGGNDNWSNKDITVHVADQSNVPSGILKYQYYISTKPNSQTGGKWMDGTNVTISKNGTYYVFFRSVSNSNVISEVSNKQTVKIDKTIPTTPVIGGGSRKWSNKNKTIQIAMESTAPSKISKYQYYVSTSPNAQIGGEWKDGSMVTITKDGIYYVFFRAVSNSGMTSKISNYQIVRIDKSLPTAPGLVGGTDKWTNTSQTVKVNTVSKALSGILKYQYYISTSNTTQTDGSWIDGNEVTITDDGVYYVFFRAISNSSVIGNVSSCQTVKIDSNQPTVPSVSFNSGNNIHEWQNNYDISLSSTALSGIAFYEVDFNGDGIVDTVTEAHYIPKDDANYSHEYRFRSVGNNGLVSGWSAFYHIHMDTTPPTKATVDTLGYNPDNWVDGPVNVSLSSSDNVGVHHYEWSNSDCTELGGRVSTYVEGNTEKPINSAIISTKGVNTMCYRAVDYAGNTGDWSNIVTVKINDVSTFNVENSTRRSQSSLNLKNTASTAFLLNSKYNTGFTD